MFFKPRDISNTPHNLEKHISYFRKRIIIGTCSKMGAAYTSIIDLSLCPFFLRIAVIHFFRKRGFFFCDGIQQNFKELCFDLLLEQPNAQQLSGMF